MEFLSVIAIVISAVELIFVYFGWIQKQADQERARTERETAREKRMTAVETKVDLFWKVVETNIGQLLKSPTHAEKDMLLDKLAHKELNIEEAERLRSILTDEMQLRGRDNGIIAYALIIGRLEGLLYELREEKKK